MITIPVSLFLLSCFVIYLTLQEMDRTRRENKLTVDNDGDAPVFAPLLPAKSSLTHLAKGDNKIDSPKVDVSRNVSSKDKLSNGTVRFHNFVYRVADHNRTRLRKVKDTPQKESTVDKGSPEIPHIIHQIWDTETIPVYLEYWVKSWSQKNPKWEYWLWTLKDGRELIKSAFPSFLSLYDSYEEDIFRVDSLRLFIMYAFGGVYADIDMISLKSLDPWTYNHKCILSEETYEHSFIVEEKNSSNVVNGFLACRPGHQFYKTAIESLFEAARDYFGDFLHATGPFFVDSVYRKYSQTQYDKNNSLTVLEPKYFLPTFDHTQEGVISYKCAPSRYKALGLRAQDICRELWRRDYKNAVDSESYANHKWLHLYMYDPTWKTKNTKPLREMVPKAVQVAVKLQSLQGPVLS